jgi:hypothetical protein
MTIYYPDISSYNTGVSLNGAPAVCIKVTEGTGYVNPDYSPALGRAHSAGAYPFAYHFLHQGNAAEQASWAHQHAGSTPLMLDFEPTGNSRPQVGDATSFIDEYRQLGGIIHLNYFPHWYWQQIGSPNLQPFVSRNLFLVSSAYTAYADEPRGVGWLPYGGQHPSIWQYTSSQPFNGQISISTPTGAHWTSSRPWSAPATTRPPARRRPRPARPRRSPTHPPNTWASRLPTRTATPASSAAATTSTCIPGSIRWPTGVGASPKMAASARSPTRYAGHSKQRRD